MSSIGRNEPCPCGSGKKYKRCCGDTVLDTNTLLYDRWRRVEEELGPKVNRFVKDTYSPDIAFLAWENFQISDEIPFHPDNPETSNFFRWFFFEWKPDLAPPSPTQNHLAKTLAEYFISQKSGKTSQEEKLFVKACSENTFSFFQVLEVHPGIGMLFRDILREREIYVLERTGSHDLHKGFIVWSKVIELEGIAFQMGNGAYALPSRCLNHLIYFREWLKDEIKVPTGSHLSQEHLMAFDEDIREMYFEIHENYTQNPQLTLTNTDDDIIAPHKLTYEITSAREAFEALKDLNQKVSKETDEELLENSEKNSQGLIQKVSFHWLKKGNAKHRSWENTSLGIISINGTSLSIEVNSERRSKRVQKEITKRLKDQATLLKIEVDTQESLIKKVKSQSPEGNDSQAQGINSFNKTPEAQAALKKIMETHWENWLDDKIPALNGLSPREATKDRIGRELLENLFLDFEEKSRQQPDELLRVDIKKLREGLGM